MTLQDGQIPPAPASPAAFDLDLAWRASPTTALRPEPFGALAYDFTSRRLSFLKSRKLVDVVRALEACPSARDALDAAGVDIAERPAYERALASLATSGLVVRRPDPGGTPA